MIIDIIKDIGAKILNSTMDDKLKGFWVSVLCVAAINFIGWCLYQGLMKSKLGANISEETTRWFNQLFNFWRKKHGK